MSDLFRELIADAARTADIRATSEERQAAICDEKASEGGALGAEWSRYAASHRTKALSIRETATALRMLAAAPEAATPSAVGGSIPSALFEARKRLSLAEGCLDCNADDERLWRFIIQFLEEYPWSTTATTTTTNAGAADTPAAIKAPSAVGGVDRMREALASADDEDPCPNGEHCCCCGPGDVCCDCGKRLIDLERDIALSRWTDFLDENPDDLTSPEDLPDHALVTFDQFFEMARDVLPRVALASGETSPERGEGS